MSFITGELMRSKLWIYLCNTDFPMITNDLLTDMDWMINNQKFEKTKTKIK